MCSFVFVFFPRKISVKKKTDDHLGSRQRSGSENQGYVPEEPPYTGQIPSEWIAYASQQRHFGQQVMQLNYRISQHLIKDFWDKWVDIEVDWDLAEWQSSQGCDQRHGVCN